MIIDTSALLAILQNEPERRDFTRKIVSASSRSMSAASFVESSIVIETRFGPEGVRDLDLFVAKAGIDISSVDVEQAELARRAFRRYGRGRHEAALNFGDCFPYALAIARGEPLLYKGRDFALTDVVAG